MPTFPRGTQVGKFVTACLTRGSSELQLVYTPRWKTCQPGPKLPNQTPHSMTGGTGLEPTAVRTLFLHCLPIQYRSAARPPEEGSGQRRRRRRRIPRGRGGRRWGGRVGISSLSSPPPFLSPVFPLLFFAPRFLFFIILWRTLGAGGCRLRRSTKQDRIRGCDNFPAGSVCGRINHLTHTGHLLHRPIIGYASL